MPQDLYGAAHARTSDPVTSHEVAQQKSPQELKANQANVLAVFRLYGPMPDFILVKLYHHEVSLGHVGPQSDSGIRTRRSELYRMGLVRWTARYTDSETGRGTAMIWEATPANGTQ